MLKRHLTIALLLGAACLSHGAAGAGELTLYERDQYNGRELTLRGPNTNLTGAGFNDRATSMVVRSGSWEVCEHANFGGDCAVFGEGRYPNLNRFDRRISSAREVQVQGRDRGGDRGRRYGGDRAGIELFSQPGMRGNAFPLRGDTDDFTKVGFNDRAVSALIEGGSWELCSDRAYRGTCRVFTPGRYEDLGRDLRARVSSARLVSLDEGRRDGRRRDRDRDQGPGYNGGAAVELFTDAGFSGARLAVNGDTANLTGQGFNDRVDSIVIHDGEWEFCVDADYRGACVRYGPGRYDRLGRMGSELSSVRRVR